MTWGPQVPVARGYWHSESQVTEVRVSHWAPSRHCHWALPLWLPWRSSAQQSESESRLALGSSGVSAARADGPGLGDWTVDTHG